MHTFSRRDFLRATGAAAAGGTLLLAGCVPIQPIPSSAGTVPAGTVPAPAATPAAFVPDVEYDLTAAPAEMQILAGQPTAVWTYSARLVKGEAANLQPLANTYLGPILRMRTGQKVRVNFHNDLPEPSIVHWHGLVLPSRMDGHPRDAIQPRETYVYEFEVANRAGTYWYHPHPEPLTGAQVIRGLAGLVLVTDGEEETAGLPAGDYDLPLVIQDRTFDTGNQIVYIQGGEMAAMPGMASMEMLMGFLGDRILVNGVPNAVLPAATRAYRLRVLNGSNSRVYKLGWSDGSPLTVIATDGGLLAQPVERPYVMLGPGERVELWADFSKYAVGSEVVLQSLSFLGAEGDSLLDGAPLPEAVATVGAGATATSDAMAGMAGMDHTAMPGMAATAVPPAASIPTVDVASAAMDAYQPALPNGAAFPILSVHVDRQEAETLTLPATLSTVERNRLEDATNAAQPRRFGLTMRGGVWRINGRAFEMEGVADDEIVKVGTLEAWDFVNEQNPGEVMEKAGMVHPMHIHGVQFQVAERGVWAPELQAGWDSVQEGYVDEGWKDTVLVMPGEQVRLLMRFVYPDLFLFHCHNLEHEDLGMMRNYRADL